MLPKFSLTLLFIFIYISTSTPLYAKMESLTHTAKCECRPTASSLTPTPTFQTAKNLQIESCPPLGKEFSCSKSLSGLRYRLEDCLGTMI